MITEELLGKVKEQSPLFYYQCIALQKLLEKKQVRELGKLIAESNEYIQQDWINENTNVVVKRRDDDDKNGAGYDLESLDGILTIQGKVRSSDLHLEQTRRKSKKNLNSADTGHVAYSVGESDLYMFTRPNMDDYSNLSEWDFIVIPEKELIDPKNPNCLLTRIPKRIWKKYLGMAVQVINEEYTKKLTTIQK